VFPPERIVCLTEETVETLYLLGEQDRIVGISGYCVRPPEARRDKPRVSAFTSADIPKILDLKPDLVLSFSDLQADIVAALIRSGVAVHAFNQRSLSEILDMIRMLGAMVDAAERANRLAEELAEGLAETRNRASPWPRRPRVYFEERGAEVTSQRWHMFGVVPSVEIGLDFRARLIPTNSSPPAPLDAVASPGRLCSPSWRSSRFTLPVTRFDHGHRFSPPIARIPGFAVPRGCQDNRSRPTVSGSRRRSSVGASETPAPVGARGCVRCRISR
jgi:iron complex transport system substrate-binding protein